MIATVAPQPVSQVWWKVFSGSNSSHICCSMQKSGFLLHGQWDKKASCIRFQCQRGKFYQQHKKEISIADDPSKTRKRKNLRPLKKSGDRCPFKFYVYWDGEVNCWFLPVSQLGNSYHCQQINHEPSHLLIQSKFVPQQETDIAKDYLSVKVSATATGAAMNKRTGMDMEWHEMQYFKKKICQKPSSFIQTTVQLWSWVRYLHNCCRSANCITWL